MKLLSPLTTKCFATPRNCIKKVTKREQDEMGCDEEKREMREEGESERRLDEPRCTNTLTQPYINRWVVKLGALGVITKIIHGKFT